MNVILIIWCIIIKFVEMQQANEIYPKARFVSTKRYQIFVPNKQIYYGKKSEDCEKLNGTYIDTNKAPDVNRLVHKFINLLGNEIQPLIVIGVCQFQGIHLLNKDSIRVLNGQLCQYSLGYCYDSDKTMIIWDTNVSFSRKMIYCDELDLWEIDLSQRLKLTFLTHKTLNLSLNIEEEKVVDKKSIFYTSLDGIFVTLDPNASSTNNCTNEFTEMYLGKLVDNGEFEKILSGAKDNEIDKSNSSTTSRNMPMDAENDDNLKENTTGSTKNSRIDCQDVTNGPFLIALLISVMGNSFGMICILTYCHKNGYFRRTKPSIQPKPIQLTPNARNSNHATFIQDNDLYQEPHKE